MNKTELAELAWDAIHKDRNPYSSIPVDAWRNLSHEDQCAVIAGIDAVADHIRDEVRASMQDIMSDAMQDITKNVEARLRKTIKPQP